MKKYALLFLTLFGIGCSSAETALTGPGFSVVSNDDAVAELTAAGVRVRSTSNHELRVAVVDKYFFDHGTASFCIGSSECGAQLESRKSVIVPLSDLGPEATRSGEAYVFTWPAGTGGGRPAVRVLTVSLRR